MTADQKPPEPVIVPGTENELLAAYGLDASAVTLDAVYRGRLALAQPRDGYRFAVDALLLADFARPAPGQTVIDLGTGVGVVALALAWRLGRGRVLAVEVQPRLAACARFNSAVNPCGSLVRVLKTDWRSLTREECGGPADCIVCNPPYRKKGTGRLNPGQEEAEARHEVAGSADDAARTAARLLKPGGLLSLVYPAARLAGLIAVLKAAGLEPKRFRTVHSRRDQPARLVLLEARLGGGEELRIEPPLFLYRPGKTRDYTEEADAILAGPEPVPQKAD